MHPSQKRKQPRALCAFASQLLNKWFRMNIVHPYPSKSEAEELAQLAGITDAQVKGDEVFFYILRLILMGGRGKGGGRFINAEQVFFAVFRRVSYPREREMTACYPP